MGVPLAELVAESVPHSDEHEAPSCVRAQVTPLFDGSFWSVAVNCCVALIGMLAEVGETETEIGSGAVTVNVAKADLVGSAVEVAVSVTEGFAGIVAGAV
jgi:hypothetical protein